MMRVMVPALMAVVFLAGPARAGEPEFRPAYHLNPRNQSVKTERGDNAVLFDDVMNLDWEQLAQAHFRPYPLTGLTEAQRDELSQQAHSGSAYIDYDVPMPDAYRMVRLILLSADGVRNLSVAGAIGTVRYELRDGPGKIAPVIHFGQIIGVPDPNNVSGGGFVARFGDGQALVRETIVGPDNPALEAVNPLKGLAAVIQIRYRFSGTEASYLFVEYEADTDCIHGCCAHSYYLFREHPHTRAITPLTFSRYGCDI